MRGCQLAVLLNVFARVRLAKGKRVVAPENDTVLGDDRNGCDSRLPLAGCPSLPPPPLPNQTQKEHGRARATHLANDLDKKRQRVLVVHRRVHPKFANEALGAFLLLHLAQVGAHVEAVFNPTGRKRKAPSCVGLG